MANIVVAHTASSGKNVSKVVRSTLVVGLLVSSIFVFVRPAAAAYWAEDIGCTEWLYTYATGINDFDQVSGNVWNDPADVRAVVYDHGTGIWSELPYFGLGPEYSSLAYAIDDDGEIVGWGQWLPGARGMYWPASHDAVIILEVHDQYDWGSYAWGMNDIQEAVGHCVNASIGRAIAVLWALDPAATSIEPLEIGAVDGKDYTRATDISNNRAIVGYAHNAYDLEHSQAFYCQELGYPLQVLPHLSAGLDGPDSKAHAISDSGLIVGESTDSDGVPHAVAWQPPYNTPPTDLGLVVGIPSVAYDVSTDEKVVGASMGTGRGFTYDFTTHISEVLNVPSSCLSSRACGINDCGHIVGYGTTSGGGTRSILWTPDAPPVAAFTATISGFNVTVDASASYDGEGEIADYSWDFGDGASESGMVVTHSYENIGPHTITLTVTDSIGQSDSMSLVVGLDKTPESEILILIELIKLTSFEQDIKERLIAKAYKALDLVEVRKKGGDDGPANILLSLGNLVSNYVLVGKIADEYEAWDVIAQNNFVISLLAENRVIGGVPVYTWYHGCGPTAAGMVLGYWDATGFGDLVKGQQGNEMYQSDDVNAMIASQGHIDDYVYPLDGWVNGEWVVVPDNSSDPNSDPHPDDCIADFMHTSRSVDGLAWGQSYANMADDALVEYTTWASGGDYVASVESLQMGAMTWEILQSEVNAAHPMVFVIDWDGDAVTDHLITVFGYCEVGNAQLYAFYSTWDNYVYWALFDLMHEGNFYGVSSGITLSISLAS